MSESNRLHTASTRSRLDHLVNLGGFFNGVKRWRTAFGISLLIAIVGHSAGGSGLPQIGRWNVFGKAKASRDELWWMIGSAILTTILVVYLLSLRQTVLPAEHRGTKRLIEQQTERTPLLSGPPQSPTSLSAESFRAHSRYTTTLFALSFVAGIIPLIPPILHIIATRESPSMLSAKRSVFQYFGKGMFVAGTLGMFISAGMIRRGPEMRFDPPKLGAGFGLPAGIYDDAEVPDTGSPADCSAATDMRQQRANVLDYDGCCLFSFIFVGYAMRIGFLSRTKGRLDIGDLPHLPYSNRAENMRLTAQGTLFVPYALDPGAHANARVTGEAAPQSKQSTAGRKPIGSWELAKYLYQDKARIIINSLAFEWVKVIAGFMAPYCLHEIVQSVDDERSRTDKSYPLLMCAGLFVGTFTESLLMAFVDIREHVKLHLPVRSALNVQLFDKILHSADAKASEAQSDSQANNEGEGRAQILNLLLIDGEKVASMGLRVFLLSNGLLTLIIGLTFLYNMFGWATFVGVAVVPLASPFSYLVSWVTYRCDRELAKARDRRISAVNEFLLSVKVIKLNAWDQHFIRRISQLREKEVRLQRRRYNIGTSFNIIADQVPLIAILAIFFTYTKVMGGTLTAATAFVAMTVFGRVKGNTASLGVIPDVIRDVLVAKISLDRLSHYLNAPEVDMTRRGSSQPREIILRDATITWPTGDISRAVSAERPHKFALSDMNVIIPQGELTLISGPLGSGKTLFLLGLLGEATILKGQVLAPRSSPTAIPLPEDSNQIEFEKEKWLDPTMTAYSPQTSYIKRGSIRDNILHGLPLWPERYAAVLRQCALLADLDFLEHGDLTQVGEQGVTLSGGQRARISLARCVYSRAKTVYLDDILSAVDAHTARFLHQKCLGGDLLKGRTVVLVSHNVNLVLPSAGFFIQLANGRIQKAATRNVLVGRSPPLNAKQPGANGGNTGADSDVQSTVKPDRHQAQQDLREIYEEEKRELGQVGAKHYLFLLRAAGGALYWIVFALLYGGTQLFSFMESLWLKYWTSDSRPEALRYYLSGYAIIVTSGIFFGALRWVWLYGVRFCGMSVGFCDRAAPRIHASMLGSLVRSPMVFFARTPTGRIINRFSEDLNRLDAFISDDFGRSVTAALAFGASLLVIAIKAPSFILVTAALLVPFEYSRRFFSKLRADLRRLASTVGSPLASICNHAINSVQVIRAFGTGRLMSHAMAVFSDVDRRTRLFEWAVWRGFSMMILSFSSLLVTTTGFIMVSTRTATASQTGFILSFALTASTGLLSLLELLSGLDQSMVAIERLNEICNLPSEQEAEICVAPRADWPVTGSICVRDLCVRYEEDLPDVLKDINLDIKGGQRVAVCGATGSGKSTFAMALFRAIESRKGNICIDGINIKQVNLHDLRSRLTAITQEPLLTSGTLRDTLDISGELDDHELYEVLRRVHLIRGDETSEEKLSNPFMDLNSFVAIEGANFSLGERQLLVLARALLKRSRIIVMDEATSNVDYATDARITEALKAFLPGGTTLITIAHRLRTIIDYDQVFILSAGRLVERGTPLELIKDETSRFHSLCGADGPVEYQFLMRAAETLGSKRESISNRDIAR